MNSANLSNINHIVPLLLRIYSIQAKADQEVKMQIGKREEFDLNEMAIFVHVVEAGSFTGAAKNLGLPKSTVSRKITQLE